MRVAIHTIQKTLFSGEAEKLIAQTPLGEITVLPNHLPMVVALKGPHVRLIGTSEEEKTVALSSGVLEIRPESECVILAETAPQKT